MTYFYVLIGFVLILTIVAFVVLLGDLPGFRGTLVHKLHTLLVTHLYAWLCSLCIRIDQQYLGGYLSSDIALKRLFWCAGWIIPFFYLAVITKCLIWFFQETFTQIVTLDALNPQNSNWRLRLWFVIIPIIFSNYSSFLLAVLSDPGIIEIDSQANVYQSKTVNSQFPYDHLLFFEKTCSTCMFKKPARSKHCSTCNKCIYMFDHHCVWLNNDVAYYTFRWFFVFLVSTCMIFIYGGYLCAYSLILYVKYTPNLPEEIVNASTVTRYWKIIKTTTFTNEITGIMFLLCLFLCPLVAYFLGETVWSTYLGVTTNEIGKWNYIQDLMNHQLLYQFHPEDRSQSVYLIFSDRRSNGAPVFLSLRDYKPFESNVGGNLKLVESWNDLNNMYDRGFFKNLHQKLFPVKLTQCS